MYAIVEITGQQFKIEKNQKIFVHRISEKEGSKVTFENVLLIDDKGKINLGDPIIKGASVTAKVLSHIKDDKVIVFKKKRRKGFQVKNGHRQHLTQIEIEKITAKGGTSTTKKETQTKDKPVKKETQTKDKPVKKETKNKTTAKKKPTIKKASSKSKTTK